MSTDDSLVAGNADVHRPPGTVTIEVDGTKFNVHVGKWIVSDLKAATGVDQTKVLAEITPHGLNDLEDNSTIEVHEGERFMSHVATGGSS